jgi:hypothetical protein
MRFAFRAHFNQHEENVTLPIIADPGPEDSDTTLTRAEVSAYLDTLPTKLRAAGKEWRGPCPIHDGDGDNFTVDPDTGLWFCHSACGRGGDIYDLDGALHGGDFPEQKARVFGIVGRLESDHPRNGTSLPDPKGQAAGAQAKEPKRAVPADAVREGLVRRGFHVVAEYPYGTQLRKVRFEHALEQQEGKARAKKEFRWEHLAGETWLSGDGGIPKPLYMNRVFRERNQPGLTLGFEGEAKADIAGELGFAAFSFKDITQEQAGGLAGCEVVLWPDHDASGEKQLKAAARTVAGAGQAHNVGILAPPPEFPPSTDIIDAVRDIGWDGPRIQEFLKTARPSRVSAPKKRQASQNAGLAAPWAGVEDGSASTCPDDLTQMIAGVEQFIRKFVILPAPAYLPIATWAIGTHLVQCFDCYPYLALLSPTKRCGKTRLLEALETLVARAWHGTTPTPAALFRMMAEAPTLLLDEVEGLNAKNKSEGIQAVLSILNAGHRQGATVPRCEGPSHEVTFFPVYGPKAFAAIGRLPDTLIDRSIAITMQRRTKAQKVERFLAVRAKAEARPIRNGVVGFAKAREGQVGQAYERLLGVDLEFLGDRDADLWIPLFAICSISAPDRLAELKECASALSRGKAADDVDDALPLKLLADIKDVWPEGEEHCATSSLLEKLKALEESPWGGFDLHSRRVAQMLRPFGVEPRQIRIGDRKVRGYIYDDLKGAFERYLGGLSGTSGTDQ